MRKADHLRPVLDPVSKREVESTPAPEKNLPEPLTPMIGREREVLVVRKILCRDDVRLLTLTGPGGVGKTRLGIRMAEDLTEEFPDGVGFVSLAPIEDSDLVVPTIARTVGLTEIANQPLVERLKKHLREKRFLLLLDNFEHVAGAAPAVGELLSGCPRLKVAAMSRSALRLSGEHEFPVPPMELPDSTRPPDVERLSRCESVALFVARARAVRHGFRLTEKNAPFVAGICARLDGLPLAIELAAARVKLFTPRALLARLEKRLPLLKSEMLDLPARQQTLRDTLRWSHDLLDESERRMFRRLSVFSGGGTHEAVADVLGDPEVEELDVMESLLDKSLIQRGVDARGEPRFSMLETVREYAMEELEANAEDEALRRAHADHYLDLAERAELRGPGQVAWTERLDGELGNFRAAMRWLIGSGDLEKAVRLGGALWMFWWIRGYFTENRRHMQKVLEMGEDLSDSSRAKAAFVAGTMALGQSDFEAATALCEKSAALFRRAGDELGAAYAEGSIGIAAIRRGEYERAMACFEKGRDTALKTGDDWGAALMLAFSAMGRVSRGDIGGARPLAERALDLLRGIGDAKATSFALFTLAVATQAEGDHERAKPLFKEGMTLSQTVGDDTNVVHCLEGLAAIAAHVGELERSARLWGAAEALMEKIEASAYPYTPEHHLSRSQYAAREKLGREAFGRLWTEGRKMTSAQAVKYAFEEPENPSRPAGLTKREVEVLALVAEGLTDGEAAEKLHLSPRTVGNHLRSVYGKLGVTSRTAATRRAIERGLV